MAKFADVLTIVNGRNQSKVENPNGQYPIYGSGGIMGYADDYLCEAGTVVIGRKGSINKPIYVDTPFWNVDTAFGLAAKRDVLLPKYLYYFCVHFDFEKLNTTVTIPSLTKANLLEIDIALPTLEEQYAIVEQLDKVEALIFLRKQQIAKLDELVKARFVEMFGDPEVNLHSFDIKSIGELVTVEPQNGMYKPQSCYVQDGTGTPILRIDAFYNGKVTDFHSLKRLTCTKAEIEKYLLHEHDIVINRVNSLEYLGKCAHIVGMYEPTVFESNMMRLHLDDTRSNACFITHLLCSAYVRKQIMNRAKKAVNQASINQNDVQSLLVLVPPVVLQHQFAAFVAQTDQQKLTIQHSLAKLELLKKALMQKYFG